MKHKRKKSRPSGGGKSGPPAAKPSVPHASAVLTKSPGADVEPRVERRGLPLWLVVLFGLLFYWAQLYLDSNAAGFDPRVYEPFQSFVHLDAVQPKDDVALFIAKGKNLFELRCGVCHQPTGLGSPGIAPPLAGSEWVNTPGPGRMIRIASNGLGGLILVKGQEYNLNMAGGFVEDLAPEELAALLSYVRQAWGNTAPIVKPDQVKAVREKIVGHGQWTADELKAIPDTE